MRKVFKVNISHIRPKFLKNIIAIACTIYKIRVTVIKIRNEIIR